MVVPLARPSATPVSRRTARSLLGIDLRGWLHDPTAPSLSAEGSAPESRPSASQLSSRPSSSRGPLTTTIFRDSVSPTRFAPPSRLAAFALPTPQGYSSPSWCPNRWGYDPSWQHSTRFATFILGDRSGSDVIAAAAVASPSFSGLPVGMFDTDQALHSAGASDMVRDPAADRRPSDGSTPGDDAAGSAGSQYSWSPATSASPKRNVYFDGVFMPLNDSLFEASTLGSSSPRLEASPSLFGAPLAEFEQSISNFAPYSAPSASTLHDSFCTHSHDFSGLLASTASSNSWQADWSRGGGVVGFNSMSSSLPPVPRTLPRPPRANHSEPSAHLSSSPDVPAFPLELPALPSSECRASMPTFCQDFGPEVLSQSLSFDTYPPGDQPQHHHSSPARVVELDLLPNCTDTVHDLDSDSSSAGILRNRSSSNASSSMGGQEGAFRQRPIRRPVEYNEHGERLSPVTGKPVRLLRKRSFPPKDADKRIYKCTVPRCNRSFGRPSARGTHVRTHTGDKPYVCPVTSCGRSFSVFSNLKRHVLIHPTVDFRHVTVHDLPKIRCIEDGNAMRLEWISSEEGMDGEVVREKHQ